MASTEPAPAAAPAGDVIEIFTDGGCLGNPGPGGWGAVMRYRRHERELSGFDPDTTNNRMELQAAIEALRAIKKPLPVRITTDSRYLKDGVTQWLERWKRNGWRTAAKKPVKNADLWQALDDLLARHKVTFHWVRGHDGHPENERADALASAAIKDGLAGQTGVGAGD